jgi:hypothetical protein
MSRPSKPTAYAARAFVSAVLAASVALAACSGTVTSDVNSVCSDAVSPASRDAKWRADVACLELSVQRRHPAPFERLARAEFERAVEDVENTVPQTSDAALRVRLMALTARFGDGTTRVLPDERRLAIEVERFPEGVYVTGATAAQQFLVGRRVVGLGNDTIDVARARLVPLVAAENADSLAAREPELLRSVDVLQGLGLAGNTGAVNVATALPGGAREDTIVQPLPATNPPAIVTWPATKPRSLARRHLAYFYEIDAARGTVYFQYNRTAERADLPMTRLATEVRAALDDGRATRLVIDLRWNDGVNAATLQPLLDRIATWPGRTDRTRLVVLVGARTAGGAFENALRLSQQTSAEIVGEPPGINPNRFHTPVLIQLAHSKQTLAVATARQRLTEDATNRLRLDRRVVWPVADYARGFDPVLAAAGL